MSFSLSSLSQTEKLVGNLLYNSITSSSSTSKSQDSISIFDFVGDTASSFLSDDSDTCTDGKDDGKIGIFGAIKNVVKGVAKSAVNAVKSCFTGSDGKFSLGKTLKSAVVGAICVACPAVGLAACAVGAVSGGIQIAKGVKNALTAETDADAKKAWQDVGSGALTLGVSVAGAKASYGAMKSTSSVGALDSLSSDATLGEKITAFAKDASSSTKNGAASLKSSAATLKSTASTKYSSAKSSGNIFEQASNMFKDAADTAKSLDSAVKALSKTAQNAYKFMSDNSATFEEAVKKYGYDSAYEAMEVIMSVELQDD